MDKLLATYFLKQPPRHILTLVAEVLGQVFNAGQFFSAADIALENKQFRAGSTINTGLCVARSSDARFLFLDNQGAKYNLYSLANGDQGHKQYYELVYTLNKQDTATSLIATLNQYYTKLFNAANTSIDHEGTTTALSFNRPLPNGLKDLLAIKNALHLPQPISELKASYQKDRPIVVQHSLSKSQLLIKGLSAAITQGLTLKTITR